MRREEIEKQLEELKERLREEKRKERIKKTSEYRRQRYKQKVFYVPKEIAGDKEKMDYYIFLKLAKQLGIRTFKKGWEIYYVDEELEKIEKQREKND